MVLLTALIVRIGAMQIELLEPPADAPGLTQAQEEMYRVLRAIAPIERSQPISMAAMMEILGLRISQPIVSRIEHLQEKGWVKLSYAD